MPAYRQMPMASELYDLKTLSFFRWLRTAVTIHDGLLQNAPARGPILRVGYPEPPRDLPSWMWQGPLLPFEAFDAFKQAMLYRPNDSPVMVTAKHSSFDPQWLEMLSALAVLCTRPDFQPGTTDGVSFSGGRCASAWVGRIMTVPGSYPSPCGIPELRPADITPHYEMDDASAKKRALEWIAQWRLLDAAGRKAMSKASRKLRYFECPMDEQIYRNVIKVLTKRVRPVARKLFLDSNPGAALFRSGDELTVKYIIAHLSNFVIAALARGESWPLNPAKLWRYARCVMHEVTRFRGQADNAQFDALGLRPKERPIASATGLGAIMPRLRMMRGMSRDIETIMQRVRLVYMYAQIMAYVLYVPANWFMWGAYSRFPASLHPRSPADLSNPEEGFEVVVTSDIGNHDRKVLDRMLWILGEEVGNMTSPNLGALLSRSFFSTVSHWDDRPGHETAYHVAGDWSEAIPTVAHGLGSGHPWVTFTVHADGLHADMSLLWRLGFTDGSVEDIEKYLDGTPMSSGLQIRPIVKGENTKKAFKPTDRAAALYMYDALRSNLHPNWETDVSDKLLGLMRLTSEENLLSSGDSEEMMRSDVKRLTYAIAAQQKYGVSASVATKLNALPAGPKGKYIPDLGRMVLNTVWTERDRESRLFWDLFMTLNRENDMAPDAMEMVNLASKLTLGGDYSLQLEGLKKTMPNDPWALLAELRKDAPRYIFDPGDPRVWLYLAGTYTPNLQDELPLHKRLFSSKVEQIDMGAYHMVAHADEIAAHGDTILRSF